jgi:hypothetical protein
MESEAGILKQRVQIAAVGRHREQARKRVRRDDDEQQSAEAEQPLNRQGAGPQAGWQASAEECDEPAEQRQHEDPQQHRAFVAAPSAGDLVQHRL